MYIVVNTEDDRICSEWNYITEKEKHICWKTPKEIEADNSYRVDNTHMKKFSTKQEAENFINQQDNSDKLITVATNFIQRWWDEIVYRFKAKHNDNIIHPV